MRLGFLFLCLVAIAFTFMLEIFSEKTPDFRKCLATRKNKHFNNNAVRKNSSPKMKNHHLHRKDGAKLDCLNQEIGCRTEDEFSCLTCTGGKQFECVEVERFDKFIDSGRPAKLNSNNYDGICINVINKKRIPKKCTTATGQWALAQIGKNQQLYKMECVCKHPNLVDKFYENGDCVKGVACGKGNLRSSLMHLSHQQWECDCPRGQIADRDEWNQPICRKMLFAELEKEANVNNEGMEEFPFQISVSDECVAPVFRSSFAAPHNRFITDPCKIDAFDFTPVETGSELTWFFDESTQKKVCYCRTSGLNVFSVLYKSDFLLNNNGRYANGVFKARSPNAPKHHELLEWNLPGLGEFGYSKICNLPIVGSLVWWSEIVKERSVLKELLASEWNTNLVDVFLFFHVPFPLEQFKSTDFSQADATYEIFHKNMPTKLSILTPFALTSLLTIKGFTPLQCYWGERVTGRQCHTMFGESGKDENHPRTYSVAGLVIPNEEYHGKLLRGGSFLGCIVNKKAILEIPNFEKTKELERFLTTMDGKYVLNSRFELNTQVILINHQTKFITNFYSGDDKEKNTFIQQTYGGLAEEMP